MKQTSWIIAFLLAANACLVAAPQQPAPTTGPQMTREQCQEMDESDTTDALAIPLDESADEQCEELDKLEAGKQK